MTYRFHVVAIGIANESGEVRGVVLREQPRRVEDLRPHRDGPVMKTHDLGSIGGCECHVNFTYAAASWGKTDRELHQGLSLGPVRAHATAEADLLTEGRNPRVTQCLEHRVVERAAGFKVSDLDRHVIKDLWFLPLVAETERSPRT